MLVPALEQLSVIYRFVWVTFVPPAGAWELDRDSRMDGPEATPGTNIPVTSRHLARVAPHSGLGGSAVPPMAAAPDRAPNIGGSQPRPVERLILTNVYCADKAAPILSTISWLTKRISL